MNSLWIRVDADELNSIRIARLSELLDVKPVVMLGHFTALCGKVAVHRPTGDINDVPATVLAQWAAWDGDRQLFAQSILRVIARDGEIEDWEDTMGELLASRRKDAERKRTERAEAKRKREQLELGGETPDDDPPTGGVLGLSSDSPRKSPTSERMRTRPNGKSESDDARSREASPVRDDNSSGSQLEALVQASHDDVERRTSARLELERTLTERGAKLHGQERVRAVDRAHLEAACGFVLARIRRREIRKPATANRHVLLRLRDTFAEVFADRQRDRDAAPRGARDQRRGLELVGVTIGPAADLSPAAGPESWQLLKDALGVRPPGDSGLPRATLEAASS